MKTLILSMLVVQAFGQTQIDLGHQGKNIDFSSQPLVRPFRTGTSLPATCVIGEMFFLTTAVAGGNSYGCSTTNMWTLQGQTGGTTGATGVTLPLQVTWSTNTVLQIGANCSVSSPCTVRVGAVLHSFVTTASVTVQSGSGLVYLYIDGAGSLTAGTSSSNSPQISCTGCQTAGPITQFPVDSIPLATWNATSGVWDPTGSDARTILSGGRTFTAGPNIQLTETGDNVTITALISTPLSSGGSGSSGLYNPTDMTEFDRTIVFADWGFNTAPFGYSGGCVGLGVRPGVAGETTPPSWLGSGNPCVLFYPAGGSGHPFVDFLSGSTPLASTLAARFAGGTGGTAGPGDLYVGWSSAADGTVANFVGLRYLASSNVWQCLIRSGGTDVSAGTMASTPDSAYHTFVVNSSTTPNTVSCKIDGSPATVTGTIPSSAWYAVLGTSGTPLTYFSALEERIQILGISR